MKISILSTVISLLLFTVIQINSTAQEVQGVTTQSSQQGVTNLSLKQAQDYALLNSNAIRNADIDLQLAKKKIWETTTIGLPQINAQATYQHLFVVPELVLPNTVLATNLDEGIPITSNDITNGNIYLGSSYENASPLALGIADNTTVDITVTQLVFSGEYLVGLRASKVYYLMSEQGKIKSASDTRESVTNTYSLVLMLKSNLEVMTQSLENLNKTLSDMREMNKQGFIENTDVDQIELTTLTLQNGVSSMNRQIEAASDLLKFQIGLPQNKEINLTDNLEMMANDVQMESLVSNSFKLENNINYQIMETQVKLGKLNMQRERSTILPNIAAVYRHHETFEKVSFDFNPKDVFLLTLNLPIFASGQRYVKIQQRQLEFEKAVNIKDNVAEGLLLEYTGARNDMINAYDTYTNVKKNLELTKRIYDKTLIKFKEGLSTSMDLTQAQNQYLSAQSEYINNLNALLTAKNKLTKLTTNQ